MNSLTKIILCLAVVGATETAVLANPSASLFGDPGAPINVGDYITVGINTYPDASTGWDSYYIDWSNLTLDFGNGDVFNVVSGQTITDQYNTPGTYLLNFSGTVHEEDYYTRTGSYWHQDGCDWWGNCWGHTVYYNYNGYQSIGDFAVSGSTWITVDQNQSQGVPDSTSTLVLLALGLVAGAGWISFRRLAVAGA